MAGQGELFETEPNPWDMDADAQQVVATVVFPEAPRGEFDYSIPDELAERLKVGARVRVPLGRGNRTLVAYCIAIGPKGTHRGKLKAVSAVLDDPPLVSADILKLTQWMADYYVCDLGPAIEAVVPAGVRGRAGTRVTTFLDVPTSVAARISAIKLPAKQAAVMNHLIAAERPLSMAELCLAVKCTNSPVKSLVGKSLVRSTNRRVFVGDPEAVPVERENAWPLNGDQRLALDAIEQALEAARHETILLHGVTGSGKTEVYIQAIEKVVSFGRQAIVLVPEISLTPQTRHRFRSRFDRVAVLHSNLSHVERHGEWQRIARGEVEVVVGARSAVFAPLPNLGLIVIDEEHEPSFKQDSVPRYHAREVAEQRAAGAGVPLLLGSATPALESWHAAKAGRYTLVSMPRRIMDRPMPHVGTIDLRNEFRDRSGYRGGISRQLHQAMRAALADGGQVILLLNRRGYSTHIQCPACGGVVRCEHCEIGLTHHRTGDVAICHYCNYQKPTPTQCPDPDCRFDGIRFGGLGTQRLEAEVMARFPGVATLRMDTDTMQGRGSHEAALDRFRKGEVKILLGTQMIAKGLDFPNVTLVGVVNADTGLHLPDFRASERTFQLVTQVAGRTGRGEKGGRVLVQTFNPEERAIKAATRHDFVAFANAELAEREEFKYPPYSHVIRLIFRGEAETATDMFSQQVAERIESLCDEGRVSVRLLGPAAAPISKLRGKFRFHLLLQAVDRTAVTEILRSVMLSTKAPNGVQWVIDADAIAML